MRLLIPALLACATALPAQSRAEALLARMTTAQKAGQLFMSWIKAEAGSAEQDLMVRHITAVGLGGVIVSTGSADQARALVVKLQAAAPTPLLMAADFENGVGNRFSGATSFGPNMLVGATDSVDLARRTGAATGIEARLLGFQFAFAPVLYVNVNPDNPIINVRSYGESPERVAALGAAFIEGLQYTGVLACAKHFPGHGDVATDSHLALPTVPGDRERLEAVELLPFRRAVAAGVAAVMTGQLAVPGLGEEPDVPATLSPRILGGFLRGDMGFQGLIVTDALEMGGVRGALAPGAVAVRALAAGADLLLMPPDPVAARDAVVAAVAAGRVPMARLDEAVGRILAAKERAGLLARQGVRAPATVAEYAAARQRHQRLSRRVAVRGITVVRDREGLWPLALERPVVLVELHDGAERRGAGFAELLQVAAAVRAVHVLHPGSTEGEIRAAAEACGAEGLLPIVACHVRVREFSGSIGLPAAYGPVVRAVESRGTGIVLSFGNPYLLAVVPGVSTYLCAYGSGEEAAAAAALALYGAVPVTGRLPVTVPDRAERGAGLSFFPGRDLPGTTPQSEGLPADLGARVRELLDRAVQDRAFPGAVALVVRRGKVVCLEVGGRHSYAPAAAEVRPDSLFDLASLTKVCATLPAVLSLVAEGRLSLDQKVQELVPGFTGEGKDAVTVRHLLTHTSGLPGWRPLFEQNNGAAPVRAAALATPLETGPGEQEVYSDLGLIALMACCEAAAATDFAHLAQRRVFDPLGMVGARFNTTVAPLPAVPTEWVRERGGFVRGFVHDENAHALGGVSGHAGLFATAEDVAKVACAFLGSGRGWLPPAIVRAALRPGGGVPGIRRGLGWDLLRAGTWAGTAVPAGTFGHTGFTGTSVWCCPQLDLCVVLLTNRVHPNRDNRKITAVRRSLHDLVQEGR